MYTLSSDSANNIYAAGNFKNSSGNRYVAKFDGTSWSELGGTDNLAADGIIFSLCWDKAGKLYASGSFENSVQQQYVAQWDGNGWTELGGLDGQVFAGMIYTVHADASGNVYTGGDFKNDAGNRFVAINSDNAVSIGKIEKTPETYLIYPNPSQNTVTIKSAADKPESTFLMTDQSGKSVFSGKVNSEKVQLNIQNLPSGNYLLNIGNNPKDSYKLIKK
jgi:hypothetical protein